MPPGPISAWLLSAATLALCACQPPGEDEDPSTAPPSDTTTLPRPVEDVLGSGCLARSWSVVQFGTPADDVGVAVGLDDLCNVYVSGNTRGVMEEGPRLGAFQDVFVARFDPRARLGWVRQLGSAQDDQVKDLAVSGAGDTFVVGYTTAAMPGQVALGFGDAFVLKHDASGGLGWLRQHGSPEEDIGLGIALSPADGSVLVAGASMEKPDISFEITLDALDPVDGTERYARRYGADAHDRGEGLAVDGSGAICIVGSTLGNLGAANAGSFDPVVLRLDERQQPLWLRQQATSDIDSALEVALDRSGNAYVLALSYSDLRDGRSENDGIPSPFVIKYDAQGQRRWTQRIGSARDFARATGIAVDPSGAVYVAGFTLGALEGRNQGGRDAFVAKLDEAGNLVWARQLGTPANDEAVDVAVSPRGDVLVVGVTSGNLGGSNSGQQDVFLARFDSNGQP